MSLAAGKPVAALSEREVQFTRSRQTAGLIAGPVVFALLLLLPLGLEQDQQTLAAVFGLTMVLWITEAIPIPVAGVVGVALCVLLGVSDEDTVFGSFASSTVFLFIGGFVIARAMSVHGLDRRFALRVLALPGVGASTSRTVIAFGVISMAVSAFISNTAAVAMLFPIALGIVASIASLSGTDMAERARSGRSPFATAVMLIVAYGASIGGLLTPIGAPHQLIGRDLAQEATGARVTFLEWSATFVPVVLVMFVLLCLILLRINKPEIKRIEGVEAYVAEERKKLGPLSRGERNALIAFGLAVTFWVLPGFVGLIAGDGSKAFAWTEEHMPEGVVAILAAATLFLLPLNWKKREFTLSWEDAVKIDWGVILLFGSGIVLGTLAGDTGLAERVGNSLADALGVSTLFSITLLATIVAIVVSETTSNTASVGIVVPIVIPIAAAVGVDPLIPALAATAGAGFGFMLPVSTPPNAIVYGSGMIPITRMIRSGVFFDIVGCVLITGGLVLMANLVGLD